MAATDRERIAELEADNRRHTIEIERLREKAHRISNILAGYNVDEYDERLRKLEAAYNRALGIAAALGMIAGAAGGFLAKLTGE